MAEPPPSPSKLDPEPVQQVAPSGFDTHAATDATWELQDLLGRLGFFSERADGVYGPSTVEAVRSFQSTTGLPSDGLAGPPTLARLRELAGTAPGDDAPTKQAPAYAAPERPTRPVQVILLRAAEDAEIVEQLMGAIQDAAQSVRFSGTSVARLADARDVAARALVVPCVTESFLQTAGSADAVTHARSGQPVMPVYLARVDPATNTLADLPAFDGGTALSEWPSVDEWLPVLGREIALRAQLDPLAAPGTYLPHVSADTVDGPDLLERRDKIEFLASVLAAGQLETPLAIGLFGDWGSGKSFFMRRLQERIVELTEASAHATSDGQQSLYCSHVRHVTFNAWLHAGTDLWPAFAAQVFRGVAGLDKEAPQGQTQESALVEYQKKILAEQERSKRIAALESELKQKRRELVAIEPKADNAAGKLASTTGEIVTRLLGLREGWRDLRIADLLPLALLGLAVALFLFAPSWAGWITAGAAVVLTVLRYADERRRLRADVRGLEERLARERQAQDAGVTEAGGPELLLPEFARREAAEWAQRAEADAVTQIRTKFEHLSRLIDAGIRAREEGSTPAEDTFPIERVIVYVDDLDRCQHDVVVNVLETLKLLLSMPHFVAVVGVDPRWLFRSLQLHFRDLLGGEDGSGDDAVWAATPQNYLEKIFQYSLVLQPITQAGFANLVEELLAPPLDAAPATLAPDGGGDAPQADGETRPDTAGTASAPSLDLPVAAPAFDLTPGELVITAEEIEFVKGLAPLFETPRSAKRLANVYRMTRVSVGAEALMDAESYEAVLMLLAIGIGFPGLAGKTFTRMARSPSQPWPEFVRTLAEDSDKRRSISAELQNVGHNDVRRSELELRLSELPSDADVWVPLREALGRCSPDAVADRTLESFAPWIPVVAEFSFHPWQELLPAETPS